MDRTYFENDVTSTVPVWVVSAGWMGQGTSLPSPINTTDPRTVNNRLEAMRPACQIARMVLDDVSEFIQPGRTTRQVDQFAAARMKHYGSRSAFLGYRKFPCHTCISVNDQIVHGLAGDRDQALVALAEARERATSAFVPSSALAIVHLGLGNDVAVLECLERGLEERDVLLPWLRFMPLFDRLHSHPRFQAILSRIGP